MTVCLTTLAYHHKGSSSLNLPSGTIWTLATTCTISRLFWLLKWQEKVLPSAKTFSNALHQAWVVEQQEKQLTKKCTSLEEVQSPVQVQNPRMALKHPVAWLPSLGKGLRVVLVVGAGSQVAVLSVVAALIDGETAQSLSRPERDSREAIYSQATSSVVTTSLDDKYKCLQKEWVNAEFASSLNLPSGTIWTLATTCTISRLFLLLKWQEKVLPSAKTFSDALHQAWVVEQQDKQLTKKCTSLEEVQSPVQVQNPRVCKAVTWLGKLTKLQEQ